MENRQKIVVGVLLTLIGCVATPLAFHYLGGEEPKVNLEQLQEQFNVQLQTQLAEQRKTLEADYNKKIEEFENMTDEEKQKEKENAIKNRRITEKLRDVLLTYYETNLTREVLIHSIDGNEQVTTLVFNTDKKPLLVKDNSSNIGNAYVIKHSNSKIQDKEELVEKNDVTFKILTESTEKFDISKSRLALDYFNTLLGRDLTEKEKTALNIQANMNLTDLSSIEDLNIYIYNGESLKIGDFIFTCTKGKDDETNLNYYEYKITSHSVTKVEKNEEVDETKDIQNNKETTDTSQ